MLRWSTKKGEYTWHQRYHGRKRRGQECYFFQCSPNRKNFFSQKISKILKYILRPQKSFQKCICTDWKIYYASWRFSLFLSYENCTQKINYLRFAFYNAWNGCHFWIGGVGCTQVTLPFIYNFRPVLNVFSNVFCRLEGKKRAACQIK